ncbi:MAG: tryptophan synthase subunit alpha [Gammaproteobacteria bacterium]|nr:tryptophan synthase subunit alpha [Gammaproteobacteria bacterium]NDA42038.1 tryptophan synthase subunit alpha [Gammaproteobacteria bacterium]
MLAARRHFACARNGARPAWCQALGGKKPGQARRDLHVRSRRQRYADLAAHLARRQFGSGLVNVKPSEKLSTAIRDAAVRGEPAIVAFMTAGFPSAPKFREHLLAVAAGADVVEIGVPFTDPMADGMTIQRSSQGALKQGVSLRWILAELAAMQRPSAPLVLMSYLNPLLQYGYAKLATEAAAAGVCGFIVPDLPFDEGAELRTALAKTGVALVQMVTPVTTPERLSLVCSASEGFVYAVTMTGTTGKNVAVPDTVLDYLDRVSKASPVPVCAGFGIRSREQVAKLREHVAGVVVGSALVEVLERGDDPTAWLQGLRPSAPRSPQHDG